jgi:hypothetical protein
VLAHVRTLVPPLSLPGFTPERFDEVLQFFGRFAAGSLPLLSVHVDAVALRRLLKTAAGKQIVGITAPYRLDCPDTMEKLAEALAGKEIASTASVILVSVFGRPDLPAIPLAVLPESGCTAETTVQKLHICFEGFRLRGAAVVSVGADGADLSAMQSFSAATATDPVYESPAITASGQPYIVRLRAQRCELKVPDPHRRCSHFCCRASWVLQQNSRLLAPARSLCRW